MNATVTGHFLINFDNYLSKPSKWCCLRHKWLISFSLCLDALKQLAFYCLPLSYFVSVCRMRPLSVCFLHVFISC